MRALFCSLLVLTSFATSANAVVPCWKEVGQQDMFGSLDQGDLLKSLVSNNPTCPFVGISWRTDFSKRGGYGTQYSLLLWDQSSNLLVRLHVHQGVSIRWESWKPVTTDSIKTEDISDGFDFPGYATGRGKAPISEEAKKFVKEKQSGSSLNEGL